jgi:hypothetical protein
VLHRAGPQRAVVGLANASHHVTSHLLAPPSAADRLPSSSSSPGRYGVCGWKPGEPCLERIGIGRPEVSSSWPPHDYLMRTANRRCDRVLVFKEKKELSGMRRRTVESQTFSKNWLNSISKALAILSRVRAPISFFPFSNSDRCSLVIPACPASMSCVHLRFVRNNRILLPIRTQMSIAMRTAWLYASAYT